MRDDEDAMIAHSQKATETMNEALQSDRDRWGKKDTK
jgi:hypothetical protein